MILIIKCEKNKVCFNYRIMLIDAIISYDPKLASKILEIYKVTKLTSQLKGCLTFFIRLCLY